MKSQLENKTEEVKEKIIGEFKPKRAFLNFISSVNKVRFIRDIAFVKGDKLSGMLDDVIFKITICDEGTINFEEVDTTLTDKAQRQRLIDDIDDLDVTGYAQKFVVANLEFSDKDGDYCYLEVDNKKPIDKLRSIFDEEEKPEVSLKGLSILEQLFGSSDETETNEVELVEPVVTEESKEENSTLSYMEESFRKMTENKIIELKDRIEEKEKEIKRCKSEISTAENKLNTTSESLSLLETRLDSMLGTIEPNGFVFCVSEEQKNETGLDETTKGIADKIADLIKLKKDALFKYLTGGFYKIRIAQKDSDFKDESLVIDKETLNKLSSIDPLGKITMTGVSEFEYRGELNWHQLIGKMIRKGFEQEPKFDEFCLTNSYESKEEVKEECGTCIDGICQCEVVEENKTGCGCGGSSCESETSKEGDIVENNLEIKKSPL